ncbi:hypothetical protein [Aquimarina algiphila]|uniref:Uncharacterized protein n=1 Tax=Aquimarina algiphila TaxID=2047982 RepID=A0A554VRL3_9FLAO|nr:hypothetical protein [Aquimarina algiphila]TSE11292.1 hypothetical protein FOF46_01290 [Aquimarina algiphila]
MRVEEFEKDDKVTIDDFVLGTDAEQSNQTKNFPIRDIIALAPTAGGTDLTAIDGGVKIDNQNIELGDINKEIIASINDDGANNASLLYNISSPTTFGVFSLAPDSFDVVNSHIIDGDSFSISFKPNFIELNAGSGAGGEKKLEANVKSLGLIAKLGTDESTIYLTDTTIRVNSPSIGTPVINNVLSFSSLDGTLQQSNPGTELVFLDSFGNLPATGDPTKIYVIQDPADYSNTFLHWDTIRSDYLSLLNGKTYGNVVMNYEDNAVVVTGGQGSVRILRDGDGTTTDYSRLTMNPFSPTDSSTVLEGGSMTLKGGGKLLSEGISITMRDTGAVILDNTNTGGIRYDADYSLAYTDRSLVDKEFVENLFAASSSALVLVDFTTDLPATGDINKIYRIKDAFNDGSDNPNYVVWNEDFGEYKSIAHGSMISTTQFRSDLEVNFEVNTVGNVDLQKRASTGQLNKRITIGTNSKPLGKGITINGGESLTLGTGDFGGVSPTESHLEINNVSGATYFDYSNYGGIKYGADYSADYEDRSLIDKGYLDGRLALIGGLTEERGTFNPVIADLGGGATYNYTLQHARYLKIGSLVYFTMYLIQVGNVGVPTGQLVIQGLPYSCLYDAEISQPQITGGNVNYYNMRGIIDDSDDTTIQILIKNALNSNSGSLYSAVSFVGGGGQIRISGTYMTASTF